MRLNTATIRRRGDAGMLEVRATFGDTSEYDYGPGVSEFTLRMANGRLSYQSAEAIRRLLDSLCEYPAAMQSMTPIAPPVPAEEPADPERSEEEETIDG